MRKDEHFLADFIGLIIGGFHFRPHIILVLLSASAFLWPCGAFAEKLPLYERPFAVVADPYIDQGVTVETLSHRFSIHYRLQGDFTNDGLQDLLISGPVWSFGKAGGYFAVYIGLPEEGYLKVGELFCRPAFSRFDLSASGQGILSTYIRSGAAFGGITSYRISRDGVAFASYKDIGFAQDPSREEIFRFFTKDVLLTPEHCIIDDGKIFWKTGGVSHEDYYRQDRLKPSWQKE